MTKQITKTGIAPRTEYVRNRGRCPSCGTVVPVDGAGTSRCRRCRAGRISS